MKRIDNRSAFGVASELLRQGEEVSIRVQGQSMLPFFRSGSVVRLRPVTQGDIVRGHVVFGQTDAGNFVIHRIIRIERTHVTLLGDGNCIGTERIVREHIYGVVNCGCVHLALARVWLWMRPLRRYPLALLRRVFRE